MRPSERKPQRGCCWLELLAINPFVAAAPQQTAPVLLGSRSQHNGSKATDEVEKPVANSSYATLQTETLVESDPVVDEAPPASTLEAPPTAAADETHKMETVNAFESENDVLTCANKMVDNMIAQLDEIKRKEFGINGMNKTVIIGLDSGAEITVSEEADMTVVANAEQDLETQFRKGVDLIKNGKPSRYHENDFVIQSGPSNDEKLRLYGLYKQALQGDNKQVQPWRVQLEANAKWTAWEDFKGKSKEDAMRAYVETVDAQKTKYGIELV